MSRIFNTLALTPSSTITHGVADVAELGWDSVPCLRLDGFTITVPDEETAKRLLDGAAVLYASFLFNSNLVVTGEPT